MAWCHPTTSRYLSQWWPRFISPYVTMPQCVEYVKSLQHGWGLPTRKFQLRIPNLQMSCTDITGMKWYQDNIPIRNVDKDQYICRYTCVCLCMMETVRNNYVRISNLENTLARILAQLFLNFALHMITTAIQHQPMFTKLDELHLSSFPSYSTEVTLHDFHSVCYSDGTVILQLLLYSLRQIGNTACDRWKKGILGAKML